MWTRPILSQFQGKEGPSPKPAPGLPVFLLSGKNAQEGSFHDKQDVHDTRKHFETIYVFDGSLYSLGIDLPGNHSQRNGI